MAECGDEKTPESTSYEEESKLFEDAADYVQQNVSQIDKNTLLSLYAHFKQAKDGPCKIPKPGFLDFQGREKWAAWKSLGEMTAKTAMSMYVRKVGEIDPMWLEEIKSSNNLSTRKKFGPIVSVLVDAEVSVPDCQKTLFDYVKEGDVMNLRDKLVTSDVNSSDETNMTLLHWACDRGKLEIVSLLIAAGADVNCQDGDGQTPLHYASSCGHMPVLIELIQKGVRKDIVDHDGQSPKDVAFNDAVRSVFDNDI